MGRVNLLTANGERSVLRLELVVRLVWKKARIGVSDSNNGA